nr:hypothetical protein [Pandoravirus belohorizontensis]
MQACACRRQVGGALFLPSFRNGDSFFCTTKPNQCKLFRIITKKKEKGNRLLFFFRQDPWSVLGDGFLAHCQCLHTDDAKDRATARDIGPRPTAISCVHAYSMAPIALCVFFSIFLIGPPCCVFMGVLLSPFWGNQAVARIGGLSARVERLAARTGSCTKDQRPASTTRAQRIRIRSFLSFDMSHFCVALFKKKGGTKRSGPSPPVEVALVFLFFFFFLF